MIAILTETQTLARQIALGLNMDVKTENEGYFHGRGFTLVWTGGELLSLWPPENRLAKSDLPFIPEAFTLSVRKKQVKKGMTEDKSAARQLNAIKNVFDSCDSIIAATDASENGELAFRRIYACLRCEKPFKRLWINSLTAASIREGFKNLREGFLFDSLYAATDCRAKADYLVNLNASRAFSLATGLANCPQDWLQTPVLAMLCKRFFEHRKFVSTRFFEHRTSLEKDGLPCSFILGETVKNRRKAEKIYAYLKTFHTAQVTKVDIQTGILPAPGLYNLSGLQQEANIRYGFSATKTLEIVRKLHEDKLISHPLADSRSIPEDVFSTIPKILRHTAVYCTMAESLQALDWESLNRRSVKNGNSQPAVHHALIPTGIYPGYQMKDDRLIYSMIAARTLEAFAPDGQKEVIRMEAAVGDLLLESKRSRITVPGWLAIQDREEDETKGNETFPVFAEGETVRISGWNLLTRKTLPPPLYTEASLLEAMENTGLGTPATRTAVIETLFENGYIERQGQNPVPAEKGLVVHNCVKNMKIAGMELSGGWERALAGVACGKQDAETFMTAFKIFTQQATEEILALNPANQRKKR